MNSKTTLVWIAIIAASIMSPCIANAEEAGNTGADLANQANEAANNAFVTLKKAIQGDSSAISEMASSYAMPALMALVFLFIGYMIASFLGRMIGSVVAKRVDQTLGKFLSRLIKNMMMVMVILGTLGFFGVDVTSFAAILAAAGFAIGMALQGTLSNFAAGIMLLIFRPFKVNDYIKVAGTEGTVEEIDLFTTRLNSVDNRHLIIPNNQIFGNLLENFSHNDLRRVDITIGTDYANNIHQVRMVLESTVQNIPGMVVDPAPQVYLSELSASSIDWQLRVWCHNADFWSVREHLVSLTKDALDNAGINIPYPQMDINVAGKSLAQAA